MITEILIALALIVAGFVLVVALRPSEFSVTRSTSIAAPPAAVFAQVNDLHNWEAWSPWAKLDPAARTSYEGPPGGVGASFAWSGNNKIGEGRMTITESRPYELIRFRLDFVKPFKGTSTAEFTFKPEGNQTVVSWLMMGRNNFISKTMQLFMSCDKMLGGYFEQGLAQMKSVAETTATKFRAAA
jgi:uncharacterized protein YndB with AHSA1/START domain